MDPMWVAVAVVVLVLSMAVAPFYWMRPSPRQRQLARLRQYALQLGLRPELKTTPMSLRNAEFGATLMKYQWHRPQGQWPRAGDCWLAVRQQPERAEAFGWSLAEGCSAGPDSLLAELQPLRTHLIAVEADPTGVGFYWLESGDSSRIDELYRVLQAWADTYRSRFQSLVP